MVKILIMDDEPGLRNIVFNMLKPLGHPLFTAEDGHQAIEIAQREIPDLAMLDMRVPDMDGLEALGELQKINPRIKAIMLSGFGDVESAITALKKGASEYISKPFKVDEVLAAVNKAILAINQEKGVTAPPPVVAPAPAPVSAPVPLHRPAPPPVRKAPPPIPAPQAVTTIRIPKKFITMGLIIGLCAVVAGGGILAWQKGIIGTPSSRTYATPYMNLSGVCWVRPSLWVTDALTGNIYKHTRDTSLSIESIYKTADTQPTGITFDGQCLWTCSAAKQRIYKHKMDNALTVEAIYALADCTPASICFDDGSLWVIDVVSGKIYKHRTDDTLSPEGVYNSPVNNPCGMFRKGEFFFIADAKTGKMFRASRTDLTVNEEYSIPQFTNGKYKLASIAWDGKNIWATAENAGKLVRIPFTALKPIEF